MQGWQKSDVLKQSLVRRTTQYAYLWMNAHFWATVWTLMICFCLWIYDILDNIMKNVRCHICNFTMMILDVLSCSLICWSVSRVTHTRILPSVRQGQHKSIDLVFGCKVVCNDNILFGQTGNSTSYREFTTVTTHVCKVYCNLLIKHIKG